MALIAHRGVGTVLGTGMLIAACTGPAPAPPATAAPPAPAAPAACVLDMTALSAATGLTWTVDEATAGDRRCVYDLQPAGTAFVAVDVAGPTDLETVAQVCARGSRTPVDVDGFVCRLPGGGVYAAQGRPGALLTLAAAEIPAGTTADLVVAAFLAQLI